MSKVGCREGTEETEHSAYTEGESLDPDNLSSSFGKIKRIYYSTSKEHREMTQKALKEREKELAFAFS